MAKNALKTLNLSYSKQKLIAALRKNPLTLDY